MVSAPVSPREQKPAFLLAIVARVLSRSSQAIEACHHQHVTRGELVERAAKLAVRQVARQSPWSAPVTRPVFERPGLTIDDQHRFVWIFGELPDPVRA